MEPSTSGVAPQHTTHIADTPREGLVNTLSFDRIAQWLLVAVVALLPVVFLPFLSSPFQLSKTVIALGLILVTFAIFVVARLKEGVLAIPYNLIFAALWALPLAYFVSALFAAPNLSVAFSGTRIETDTLFFVLIMALLTTVVPLLIRSKQGILSMYTGLLVSFLLLALYQGLRLIFGVDFLSFGIFTNATANLVGKWNDVGIFFGFMAILALITLEGLRLRALSQSVLFGVLGVSLFFVAVVNFTPVWIAVGLFALSFFVYSFFRSKLVGQQHAAEEDQNSLLKNAKISVIAIVVLVIAAVFTIYGATLGNALPTALGISHLEARPSWQSTAGILKATYAENAFLGSGPNTFVNQWASFKPSEINTSLFWGVDFSSGIGLIPTAFVTTGLLGAAAWIAFLGLLVYLGIKALLLRPAGEGFSYYLTLSSFIASVYLWIFSIVYVPNVVLIVMAFLFSGLFLASLRHQGLLKEKRFVFAENPRLGFVSVLGLTVVLILTLIGVFLLGERYVSASQFQRAVVSLNMEGDLDKAEIHLLRAISVKEIDNYRQLAAEMQLLRLNTILNDAEGNIDERRQQFQEELAEGIQHAQRATEIRPENYQNWLTLGRVYQAVVPLQIQGAYDNAVQSFDRAKALAPHHPQIYLAYAELEAVAGNNAAAKEYLNQALAEKNNYTAAVFLLAQLQIAEGDLENALQSVQAATILAPQNPVVFFQHGLLLYNKQDFTGAISALERAVALNEVYANARYFLGLAYVKEDHTQEAIAQFTRIQELNPDNREVALILTNLREGKEPFAGSEVTPPEDRDAPPIEGE